jgi:Flp pilus assembly protein protease CpaA
MLIGAGIVGMLLLCWSAYADTYRGRLLPDLVPLIGLVGFAVAGWLVFAAPLEQALMAAITAVVFLVLVAIGGMGMGDAKLAPVIVLWLGWVGLYGLLLAIVLAAAYATPVWAWRVLRGAPRRGHTVALVPFIYAGTILAVALAAQSTLVAAVGLGGLGIALATGWVWHRRHPFHSGRSLMDQARTHHGTLVLDPNHPARLFTDNDELILYPTRLGRDRVEYALDDLLSSEAEAELVRTGHYEGTTSDGSCLLRVNRLRRGHYRVEVDTRLI